MSDGAKRMDRRSSGLSESIFAVCRDISDDFGPAAAVQLYLLSLISCARKVRTSTVFLVILDVS